MALFNIGGSRIQLWAARDDHIYELHFQEEITITREPNAASVLSCTVLRDGFSIDVGDAIKLTLDEQHHQFFGYVIDVTYHDKWADITAYDQIYYLAKSKTRYVYKDTTATNILKLICEDCQMGMLDPPSFEDTEYKIPYRIEDNVSYLDIICNALDITFENTGIRYYIWDDAGSITLTQNAWLAGETSNIYYMSVIEDYRIKKSLNENFYTVARFDEILTQDTEVAGERKIYSKANEEAVARYGHIEYRGKLEEKQNGDHMAQTILDQASAINETITLSGAQGDITVRGGTPIMIDFYTIDRKERIRGWYTVDSVTHHIKSGLHTMDVTCHLLNNAYDDWNRVSIDNAYIDPGVVAPPLDMDDTPEDFDPDTYK